MVCKTTATADQDRYLDAPPDENQPNGVGGRQETPAHRSLTIRECALPAAGSRRRNCGHSSVGRTIPCQGIGRRFESGCPLHDKATFCRVSGEGGFVMEVDRSTSGEVTALSRQPGWVRIPHGLPTFMRGWHMGCAPAFQAGQASSSLAPRPRFAAVAETD